MTLRPRHMPILAALAEYGTYTPINAQLKEQLADAVVARFREATPNPPA